MMLNCLTFALLAGTALAQFGEGDFLKNLRVLQGSALIYRVEGQCRKPLETFGKCFIGNAKPKSGLGRAFLRRGARTMKKINKDDDIKSLVRIGERVDKCFEDNGCPLNPVKAAKCFLDFIINGGPYDRVGTCLRSEWGTPNMNGDPPKFGDLSSVEDDVKLFAGIGLYKRYKKDVGLFWEKYEEQISNLCLSPSKVNSVKNCITEAIESEPALNLDVTRILRRQPRTPYTPNDDVLQRLSVFGEEEDVKLFISLLTYRVIGCGLDLFETDGSNRQHVIGIMRGDDPCAVPSCIQYVWTIKDGLCNSCRTSMSQNGEDPFRDTIAFLRDISQEFVNTVSDRDYKCKAKGKDVCSGCSTATKFWKASNTNVLRGFGAEAIVITKLLEDVCKMGDGVGAIGDGYCPSY